MPAVRKVEWLADVEDLSDMGDYEDDVFSVCQEDHENYVSYLVDSGALDEDPEGLKQLAHAIVTFQSPVGQTK